MPAYAAGFVDSFSARQRGNDAVAMSAAVLLCDGYASAWPSPSWAAVPTRSGSCWRPARLSMAPTSGTAWVVRLTHGLRPLLRASDPSYCRSIRAPLARRSPPARPWSRQPRTDLPSRDFLGCLNYRITVPRRNAGRRHTPQCHAAIQSVAFGGWHERSMPLERTRQPSIWARRPPSCSCIAGDARLYTPRQHPNRPPAADRRKELSDTISERAASTSRCRPVS